MTATIRPNSFFSTLPAILGFSVLSTDVLLAQEPALEEIIVTAERREASLQEVPVSVLAFGANDIEALNVVDFQDMQSVTPNLNVQPGRGSSGAALSFNIRGIGGIMSGRGFERRS